MVLDRVVGDEQPDGSVKPPDSASARLLVRKYEIGSVLGLRGVVINEIRTQTGASVKIEDNAGDAGMPIALPDDQLVKVGGCRLAGGGSRGRRRRRRRGPGLGRAGSGSEAGGRCVAGGAHPSQSGRVGPGSCMRAG
jgi:hypothetical protein